MKKRKNFLDGLFVTQAVPVTDKQKSMDHHHEQPPGIEAVPEHTTAGKKVWNGFFMLMYPAIIAFSLVFTGLLLVFSGISKVFSALFSLIPTRAARPKESAPERAGNSTDGTGTH